MWIEFYQTSFVIFTEILNSGNTLNIRKKFNTNIAEVFEKTMNKICVAVYTALLDV
jgi:hypothetical protein